MLEADPLDNPALKLYPGLFHAFGLVLVQLILSVCANLVLVVITGTADLAPLTYTAGMLFAISMTLYIGWTLSEAPAAEAFPTGRLPAAALLYLALLIAGIAVFLTEAVSAVFKLIPVPAQMQEHLMNLAQNPAFYLYAIFLGPALEEMLMRGIVLRGLLSRYSVRFAVTADALLFAVMHFNPWQFLSAFVLGALTGWLFARKRSIVLCIAAHMMWNGLFFLQARISGVDGLAPSHSIHIPLWMNAAALVLVITGFRQLKKHV